MLNCHNTKKLQMNERRHENKFPSRRIVTTNPNWTINNRMRSAREWNVGKLSSIIHFWYNKNRLLLRRPCAVFSFSQHLFLLLVRLKRKLYGKDSFRANRSNIRGNNNVDRRLFPKQTVRKTNGKLTRMWEKRKHFDSHSLQLSIKIQSVPSPLATEMKPQKPILKILASKSVDINV